MSDSLLLVIFEKVEITRSLSADLRQRVVAAIEDRISTAGAWHRRYRKTGETQARIEVVPDITLAEIGERLAAEHGMQAAPSTVWLFLVRRGTTFKKDGTCLPSSSARCLAPPHHLI